MGPNREGTVFSGDSGAIEWTVREMPDEAEGEWRGKPFKVRVVSLAREDVLSSMLQLGKLQMDHADEALSGYLDEDDVKRYEQTHPLFPICRTPFPPYVRNEFSFFRFFRGDF